jgi:murein DD-endopeptidase MepM/ murein hydrolase activator NlpD
MPGLTARYLLPFTAGETHELTQGNCGGESHDGRFRYAFDFRMPAGTPVVAARSGTVVLVRDDRPDGTGRVGDENLVMIEHADGQRSRYIHLRQHAARVSEGDRVAPGDTIALSGNSGRSAFPHLHFDVADRCGREGCHTVPVAFLNAEPPVPIGRGPVTALGSAR